MSKIVANTLALGMDPDNNYLTVADPITNISITDITVGNTREITKDGDSTSISGLQVSSESILDEENSVLESFTVRELNDPLVEAVSWTGINKQATGVNADSLLHLGDLSSLLSGSDQITGSNMQDTVMGFNGKDTIFGRKGGDTLSGGNGSDTISGGGGNDVIDGGKGNDVLDGGNGRDTIRGQAGNDRIDGQNGNDSLGGQDGADTITGGLGNDSISGGGGADILAGGNGNDTIRGGGGADRLIGGRGKDVLDGGAGSDTLDGGRANDTLTGGNGGDTFVFKLATGDDTITGFLSATDLIDVSDYDFANGAAVIAATNDVGGNAVIDLGGGNSVTLDGVLTAQLNANDFIV